MGERPVGRGRGGEGVPLILYLNFHMQCTLHGLTGCSAPHLCLSSSQERFKWWMNLSNTVFFFLVRVYMVTGELPALIIPGVKIN